MTRTNLEQAVYRDFGYADTPATAISNRIVGYLNDRHRRILTGPGRESLRKETVTFSTVAGTATYALNHHIARIRQVVNTTNAMPLYERSLDWYRQIDPNPTGQGTSIYWVPLGTGAAIADVSTGAGTGLWVVSTAAGDTTQAVHVETIDALGNITSTTANLNGTTRVQIGTATNHIRVTRFAVSAAVTGQIELYNAAAAGTLVSRIPLHRSSAQFVQIALWPTPSAVNTIQLDVIYHIRDFGVAYDEPQLPQDFHYLVALGAKIDEARKHQGGDAQASQWEHEYAIGLAALDNWIINENDTIIVPGDTNYQRRSNLGPAFPTGVWES